MEESNNVEIFDSWYDRKREENERPGTTMEQQVLFQVELARRYLDQGWNNDAYNTLNHALDMAVPEIEAREKELKIAVENPQRWVSWRCEKRPDSPVTDIQGEAENIRGQIKRLKSLIPEIIELRNSTPEDPID